MRGRPYILTKKLSIFLRIVLTVLKMCSTINTEDTVNTKENTG